MPYRLIIPFLLISSSIFADDHAIKEYGVKISEPSGLSYDSVTDTLWSVSDRDGKLYNISRKGKVLEVIDIRGNDLEGVAINSGILYALDESRRSVYKYTPGSRVVETFPVKVDSTANNGPEGLTIYNSEIYILNEKNPGLLQVYSLKGELQREYELDFASDYAGITYDSTKSCFLILSQEDKALYQWTPGEREPKKIKLDIKKPEGVAIDNDGVVFIVSDDRSMLFSIPQSKQKWK